MAKKIDPKAKAKRQKVIAAVGGVILLGVLAFQVPRTLKMLHQQNANASSSTTTTSTTSSTTASTPVTSSSGGSGDGLNDPDVLPTPQSGQLLGFSRFRSKDPFSQQVNLHCGSDSGSTGDSSTVGCGGSSQTTNGTPAKPTKPAGTTPPSGHAAKPASAEISVNGVTSTVAVGAKFPASNPTFVLVSLTKRTAKIGIAGGSIEGGQQTVTLKKGVSLTLMNTADGTRYVLRLLSVS